MATVAVGTASFTTGGAETATFTWLDAFLLTPVTFSTTPTVLFGPCQTVSSGGAGNPYIASGGITTTGGTVTMANPGTCTVTVTAVGS